MYKIVCDKVVIADKYNVLWRVLYEASTVPYHININEDILSNSLITNEWTTIHLNHTDGFMSKVCIMGEYSVYYEQGRRLIPAVSKDSKLLLDVVDATFYIDHKYQSLWVRGHVVSTHIDVVKCKNDVLPPLNRYMTWECSKLNKVLVMSSTQSDSGYYIDTIDPMFRDLKLHIDTMINKLSLRMPIMITQSLDGCLGKLEYNGNNQLWSTFTCPQKVDRDSRGKYLGISTPTVDYTVNVTIHLITDGNWHKLDVHLVRKLSPGRYATITDVNDKLCQTIFTTKQRQYQLKYEISSDTTDNIVVIVYTRSDVVSGTCDIRFN